MGAKKTGFIADTVVAGEMQVPLPSAECDSDRLPLTGDGGGGDGNEMKPMVDGHHYAYQPNPVFRR